MAGTTTDVQETRRSFDPARHLTLVTGKEYLEVKWRLVWLRAEHPDAIIHTEMVSHEGHEAVFRAKVTIPDGGAATGWGSEDASGFGDYIEKAETKAIGRALAALGYGTQFCQDFEFGAANGRVVDAPVKREFTPATERQFEQRPPERGQGRPQQAREAIGPTDRQLNLIERLKRDLRLTDEEYAQEVTIATGKRPQDLDRRETSSVIEHLNGLKNGG